VSTDDLFDALSSLSSDRRLPKEIDAILDPFLNKTYALSLIFTSASRTFANPSDPTYEGGQTILGRLVEGETEVTLLLHPDQGETVAALQPGDTYETTATLLAFDNLYHRPVFGQPVSASPEESPAGEQPPPEQTKKPVPASTPGKSSNDPKAVTPRNSGKPSSPPSKPGKKRWRIPRKIRSTKASRRVAAHIFKINRKLTMEEDDFSSLVFATGLGIVIVSVIVGLLFANDQIFAGCAMLVVIGTLFAIQLKKFTDDS